MELLAQDFYFDPNGRYTTVSKWKSQHLSFEHDLKEIASAIRIFGTKIEIDRALDEYINKTELTLDECYTYKVEKEGSFFYNEEQNKIIAKKLQQYKEMYKDKKGALILNLK
tara:strand:+ start:590 stop:925 length:336 start_codon:yes stop_codon:yes gene_type:complete